MNNYRKKLGFTLVEMIITVVLLSLVLIGVGSFLRTTGDLSEMQNDEFYFQSDMRDSMKVIEENIKKSKAVFAIQEKDFLGTDDKPLDKDWTYVGVSKTGVNEGQVCIFKHNGTNWEETPLTSGKGGVKYTLVFDKPFAEGAGQKTLTYTLTGIPDENTDLRRSLSTSTEVLSAFTIVDRSKEDDTVETEVDIHDADGNVTGTETIEVPKHGFSVAIAFRTGEVELPDKPLGSITFVVDVSGSMRFEMEKEQNASSSDQTRMFYVNRALKDMINSLDVNQVNVDISIVDFAEYANCLKIDGKKYTSLKDKSQKIRDSIDLVSPDRWLSSPHRKRAGGTNIGDGLRLAYANLQKHNLTSSSSVPVTDYVILLTDGLPGNRTMKKNTIDKPYFGDAELTSYSHADCDVIGVIPFKKLTLKTNNGNGRWRNQSGGVITSPNYNFNYYWKIPDVYCIKDHDLPSFDGLNSSNDSTGLKRSKKIANILGLNRRYHYGQSYIDNRLRVYEPSGNYWGIHSGLIFDYYELNDSNFREKTKKLDCVTYAEEVCKYYNTYGSDLKSFVVTVGNIKGSEEQTKDCFERISVAMGNAKDDYYEADNVEKLNQAIGKITKKILADCWTYTGPISK